MKLLKINFSDLLENKIAVQRRKINYLSAEDFYDCSENIRKHINKYFAVCKIQPPNLSYSYHQRKNNVFVKIIYEDIVWTVVFTKRYCYLVEEDRIYIKPADVIQYIFFSIGILQGWIQEDIL